ncbi:MAG: SpoIIE family protein phosphatase [Bacteroidetes Order II. Incertae sedis bacterium]|jgi:phosphoserine phosphatase RsbU/P|nr:SpoIIE family protein phosphatase [Bacteroidetes Order II. bacterium]MBT4052182.1 SpoIIE family protein phosphatase [Bacteroidetes Order II. bacterium]MBT4602813.1 SpoIIE family protein phosphatase [Bacteroidetes Order II. bacterium]MBT5248676.1 SpoIIE family protein phosphatase [Bacteroidetes Order II. bacterium]MBT6200439.1 SpoIIE family protein phosphatase [Bacteroidetes Order II. bacterium]
MSDQHPNTRRTDRFDLRAIYETSQLLSSSLDLEFVLSNLLRTAMGKLLVTKGAALLYDPLAAAYSIPAVKGISGLEKGGSLVLTNVDLENTMQDDRVPAQLQEVGIKLVFPVAFGHREIGLIGLGGKFTGQPFEDQELEFMASLVNMSSAAVHNSLMVEELKLANRDLDSKVQQLNTLFDLSQEFNSTVDRSGLVKLLTFALMGQMLVKEHVFLIRSMSDDTRTDSGVHIVTAKGIRKDELSSDVTEALCKVEELVLLDGENTPEGCEILKEKGFSLILPIRQQGEVGALLCLGAKMTGQAYQPDEIEFLYALGNLAFVSLHNSYLVDDQLEKERLEEEMRLAREIQERLQPTELPKFDGIETASLALPSRHVAGDYFDAIELDKDRILYAIADVTGKGVPASLLMSNLQACLRILVPLDLSLEEGTAHMNRVITENTGYDKFITYFHGVFNKKDSSFKYVNAGHNPPTLVRADGSIELLEEGGLLLGVLAGMPYESGTVTLNPGDVLAMFTDGVTEAMSPEGEEWGEERLEPLLASIRTKTAEAILDDVHEAIKEFTHNAPILSDDLTMIVLKTT